MVGVGVAVGTGAGAARVAVGDGAWAAGVLVGAGAWPAGALVGDGAWAAGVSVGAGRVDVADCPQAKKKKRTTIPAASNRFRKFLNELYSILVLIIFRLLLIEKSFS